ncbi:hypothetical protein BG000_011136 [Podila horticola]|nr:hypothetical protein BG000_011136 [Podila horticola]
MDLYTQQASSSPRPLSLIREESDRAQFKNETASTEENPSSSDMDDVLLLDVMQATDPTYSRFDTLISLENETTAARHQDSAGLLSALSAEQLEQSAMALDEIPSLQGHTLTSNGNSSDPSLTICSSSSNSQPNLSSSSVTNNCTSATLPMDDSTAIPPVNSGASSLSLLPSFPHAKAAKLLSSRNINNSTDFFLDSGIAGAAEGESPPPWLWEAYRRASVAAVDSLLKEQQNQQRLLMIQQQQIEQMKLLMLQERMLHQQNSSGSATVSLDFHPQSHHQLQGLSFQQPDQEQAPPLFWPTPSLPSSSSSQLLETQTSTQITSPSLSSNTPASPRAGKHRRHDDVARQHGIARRASQGASICGPLKGSAMMERSKSAVNSPSIGSRSSLDRASSSPRAVHTLAKALGGLSASFTQINHLDLLQGLNSPKSTSNTESASASDADSSMMMDPDYDITDMDLTALLSVGMPFDFSGHMDGIHCWDGRSHSPTGSASSRSPSPSASPSLSPTPSLTKSSSSSTPGALPYSTSSALSGLTNDSTDRNNPTLPAFARTDALCRHYKVEEQCRRAVIQMQILENENRERERVKKEQQNVLFASGQSSGQEAKEARGHGNLRKWQQFLVQQLMQQESAALEKARMLQIHQSQQSQCQQQSQQPPQQQQQQQPFVQEQQF